jgi:uracil-DNA glycosylase family 4
MDQIRDEIMNCTKCGLCKERLHAVPGEGSVNAQIMFIGEAPGKNEDQKGIPFCGASGKLLDLMLENIGLAREDVFITNIVKCRPPLNRDPEKIEIDMCSKYLKRQILLINPKVICTLGRFSMNLFFPDFRISKVHGQVFKLSKFNIIPLYHPAVGLYRDSMKEILFSDFEILKRFTNNSKATS